MPDQRAVERPRVLVDGCGKKHEYGEKLTLSQKVDILNAQQRGNQADCFAYLKTKQTGHNKNLFK